MTTIPAPSASRIHPRFSQLELPNGECRFDRVKSGRRAGLEAYAGVTMSLLPKNQRSTYARWLLPISLALNVCFVGAAGAVAYRYTGDVPLPAVDLIGRSAGDRLDRVAAALPANDAQIMRAQIHAEEVKVAAAQADLRLAQEEARNALRAEPFDMNAMRASMAEVQVAREKYHTVLHEVFEASAPRLSVVGRNMLANLSAIRGNVSP
jgi:uncharacterized membrane protein